MRKQTAWSRTHRPCAICNEPFWPRTRAAKTHEACYQKRYHANYRTPSTETPERRERRLATQRAAYERNKEHRRQTGRERWHRMDKPTIAAKAKARNFARYSTTEEQFYERLAKQGGTCGYPPCQLTTEPDGRRLALDHDHDCCPPESSCGKCIRAIMCRIHNTNNPDDPAFLAWRATMIEEFKMRRALRGTHPFFDN